MLESSNNGRLSVPQAARRDEPVQCRACGRTVPRISRSQRFSSTRCRKRDFEKNGRTRVILADRYQDTRDHDAPSQKPNNFNGLQGAKSGSNPRIYGPRRVIEVELLAGRDWTPVVSPDGVVCMVASWRRS